MRHLVACGFEQRPTESHLVEDMPEGVNVHLCLLQNNAVNYKIIQILITIKKNNNNDYLINSRQILILRMKNTPIIII